MENKKPYYLLYKSNYGGETIIEFGTLSDTTGNIISKKGNSYHRSELHPVPDNNVVNPNQTDAANINEGSIPNQSMVEGETVEQAAERLFEIAEREYSGTSICDWTSYKDGFFNAVEWQKSKSTSENERLKAEVQELREVLSESITEIIKLKIYYKDSGHGKKFIKKVKSLLAKHT